MSETTSLYDARRGDAWLFGSNAPYAEEMYEHWLENPASVPDTWRGWFESLQLAPSGGAHTREPQITTDPETGTKILKKRKPPPNAGFKVHRPVTDW